MYQIKALQQLAAAVWYLVILLHCKNFGFSQKEVWQKTKLYKNKTLHVRRGGRGNLNP